MQWQKLASGEFWRYEIYTTFLFEVSKNLISAHKVISIIKYGAVKCTDDVIYIFFKVNPYTIYYSIVLYTNLYK